MANLHPSTITQIWSRTRALAVAALIAPPDREANCSWTLVAPAVWISPLITTRLLLASRVEGLNGAATAADAPLKPSLVQTGAVAVWARAGAALARRAAAVKTERRCKAVTWDEGC